MKIVEVPSLKKLVQPSSWKNKKLLADAHLDVMKLCQYGCRYCSSNFGHHIRWQSKKIDEAVFSATGQRFDPKDVSRLALSYADVVAQLEAELHSVSKSKGDGQTIVYSQLTDGFSPSLVQNDIPRRVLDLILERTSYRIRILTKNAIVGRGDWISYFKDHRDRFVVGLSIGTMDDSFSKRMELLASLPSQRMKALRALQDAGIPTYGMLCPVFPNVLQSDEFEKLVAATNPGKCEHVWIEPFNDRSNWRGVRSVFEQGSQMWDWMTEVYENKSSETWSAYATDLYLRALDQAIQAGWTSKLRYMLYESQVAEQDAAKFGDGQGLLLQQTDKSGVSKNPAFAAISNL